MSIQGPGGGEPPPKPKPELPTVKPPEVKAPEARPLGQTEQAMVARIDKDGAPDLVLQDLARTKMPQAAKPPSFESQPPATQNNTPAESASSQQKYIVTRNGQMMEVTIDQMTPEERAAFEETTEPPKFEHNPLEDPAGFFGYLKQRNTDYAYESDVSPEMVKKAVEWAQSRGFDPAELSPAQIHLSQEYIPGTKTEAEVAEQIKEERTVRLQANKDELLSILASTGTAYFHATPVFENVQSIFKNGLYCDSTLGLGGSAAPLDSVPPNADQKVRDQVAEANAKKLADPHRGYRYEVIIELPQLTVEQRADYQTRRARNENVSYTSYYVQKLAEQVGAQGVERTYDAVLPPQYIKGFIDLDTGQFIPRQTAT